jgi:hypothetical protein
MGLNGRGAVGVPIGAVLRSSRRAVVWLRLVLLGADLLLPYRLLSGRLAIPSRAPFQRHRG